jgi:hypothetical protein
MVFEYGIFYVCLETLDFLDVCSHKRRKIVPTSTIFVSVFVTDTKSPCETFKYGCGPEPITLLDFADRDRGDTGRSDGSLCTVWFSMQPVDRFNRRLAQLEAKDLRSLLEERPSC